MPPERQILQDPGKRYVHSYVRMYGVFCECVQCYFVSVCCVVYV